MEKRRKRRRGCAGEVSSAKSSSSARRTVQRVETGIIMYISYRFLFNIKIFNFFRGPAAFARLGILDLRKSEDAQDFIVVQRIIHPR